MASLVTQRLAHPYVTMSAIWTNDSDFDNSDPNICWIMSGSIALHFPFPQQFAVSAVPDCHDRYRRVHANCLEHYC